MEKYLALIEYLKAEYWNHMFELYGDNNIEKEKYEKLVFTQFDIESSEHTINRLNHIKRYDIREKQSKRGWNIIVGPAMLLFGKNLEYYRKQLLEENPIRGIVTLKNGFFERSSIPAAVIILGESNDNIFLTSAASAGDILALLKDVTNYQRKVYYTKSLNPQNFMPEYYNGEAKALNDTLDRYETKKLSEIADIILGKSVPSYELTTDGIPYLRARDIQNGQIVKPDIFVPEELAPQCAKQLLQEGDILLSKNFGQHKIARVTTDVLPAIASNGFFIIRAFGVPEDYLYQYLTSQTGKAIFDKQLASIEKGAVVVSIGLSDLKELKVPLFDEQTMVAFGNIKNVEEKDLVSLLSMVSRLDAYSKALERLNERSNNKSNFEQGVISSLKQVGWNDSDISTNNGAITLKSGSWIPDILLMNAGIVLAAVEIKTDLSFAQPDWVKRMYEIVKNDNIPFWILTTGSYYEIHGSKNTIVKKMETPPTKDFLLSLMLGKEEN